MRPWASTRYSAGQYWLEKAFHVAISESTATGQLTPSRCTADAMLAWIFSKSNSGECTPTITRPRGAYALFNCCRCGMVRTQFTQENVQKSNRTTCPLSAANVSGALLIQASIPVNSGAAMRSLTGNTPPGTSPDSDCIGGRNTVTSTTTPITTTTARSATRNRFMRSRFDFTVLHGRCPPPRRIDAHLLVSGGAC